MSDNIKSVNFGNKDDVLGAMESFKRNLPSMVEYQALLADYRYKIYQEYIQSGFSEEQAFQMMMYITNQ